MKFTKENIAKIEAEFERRKQIGKNEYIEFDDQLKGFGLRLQGNSRTWIVQYRSGLKQRRVKIGPRPRYLPRTPMSRHARLSPARGRARTSKRNDWTAAPKIRSP